MPALTSDHLTILISRIRDLIGDASSEACDCASEVSDQQIIAEINNCREMVRYERSEAIHQYAIGGSVEYKIHRFQGNLAGNYELLDSGYTPLTEEQISHADPLAGIFETADSHQSLFLVGDRVDVFLCGANLLRSLRIRKRNSVDQSEMGVSIKLSQALQVMADVEESYRCTGQIGVLHYSRSDVA